jgi:hypothetical protein
MIPITNVYYLLLYAWDALEQSDLQAVAAEPKTDLLDLLAAVLNHGVDRLLRQGLQRDCRTAATPDVGVPARNHLVRSVRRGFAAGFFWHGRAKKSVVGRNHPRGAGGQTPPAPSWPATKTGSSLSVPIRVHRRSNSNILLACLPRALIEPRAGARYSGEAGRTRSPIT